MDHLDAVDVAIGEFRQRLVGVADHQWSDATPCDGWDVRDLVVHVVGGNRFGAMVLAGATADDAMASVINDSQLGTDPLAEFDTSAAAQRQGFRRAGALAAPCDHLAGPLTGGEVPGDARVRRGRALVGSYPGDRSG